MLLCKDDPTTIVLVTVITHTSNVFKTDNPVNASVNNIKMGREYNPNCVVCIHRSVIDNGKTTILKNESTSQFNSPGTAKMQLCFGIKSLFGSFMIKCENENIKHDWINISNATLDKWRQTLVEHNQNSNINDNSRIERCKCLFCTYCGDLTCPNCRNKKGTLPSKIDPSATVRVCNQKNENTKHDNNKK